MFDADANTARQILSSGNFPVTTIGKIAIAYHHPRFKRNFVNKEPPNAIAFLGSSEMLDVKTDATKYLLCNMAENLRLFTDKDTVLISCSGTIGNVSYVNKTLESFAFSQHIIGLECDNFSGYLYACLKTEAVQKQIQVLIYGAVIPEIEP